MKISRSIKKRASSYTVLGKTFNGKIVETQFSLIVGTTKIETISNTCLIKHTIWLVLLLLLLFFILVLHITKLGAYSPTLIGIVFVSYALAM